MTGVDRWVLRALQALVLLVPLCLGGRHPLALLVGCPLTIALLAVTWRERRVRGDASYVPGVALLAGLVALALATTVPVPPSWIATLAPATSRLYTEMLPGWPDGGGWSAWRPLAIDPYGVWSELARWSLGLGVFAVVVAFPWRGDGADDEARGDVTARLLATVLAGGVALALLGFVQQVAGNGQVLWITDADEAVGRASGPFVNPNHFAAWLEMALPLALAVFVAAFGRVRRSIQRAAESGRRLGVPARRAWASALIAQQQRLLTPLLALAALLVMGAAHAASGSRGGTAALLVGAGVTAAGLASHMGRGHGRLRRAAPLILGGVLVAASLGSLALWTMADADSAGVAAADDVDVNLGSRLAVMAAGVGVVRDHALVGTGAGSWLHAFRPYQQPPVDGGIWDHAHNDYLEFAADTGVLGVLLVLAFVVVVARAVRRHDGPARDRRPPGFEVADWRAALGERGALRWGIAGGVAAILVHSTVDFGLRMPANLVLLMLLVGVLVLTAPRQPVRRDGALAALVVLLALVMVPLVANRVRTMTGGTPLSPSAALEQADILLAEEGDAAQPQALALVRAALEQSPADREAHEMHATVLGAGPEADAALRRAMALDPRAPELRDRLAFELRERGEHDAATRELEASMTEFPWLVSHAWLTESEEAEPQSPATLIRTLAEGDGVGVRLAALDADETGAIVRGLRRALVASPSGETRLGITDDLATVLEARGEWGAAAELLRTEAERSLDGGGRLARAARDYLTAGDDAGAERALLAALVRTPERGDLYRRLAVEVYAARGDFPTAERVLDAGERNAVDMTPVWQATTEVLARREAAWASRLGDVERPEPMAALDDEVAP
jgi:O-antigen ligase/Tfp pilus assembly protein PilF